MTTAGLLDTSVVIALARGLDPTLLPDESFISTITLAELSVGPLVATTLEGRMARQMVLQQAEADFTAVPFSAEAGRRYGQIAAALRTSGRTTRTRAFDNIPVLVVIAVPSPA